MGEDTDQLTADIAQTRDRMSGHLDELQDKVSPTAIVDRQKQAARAKVGGIKEKAFGTARSAGNATPSPSDASDAARHQVQGAPIAAGLAAFGLGMVIAALVPATEAESKAAVQVKDVVQDKAQPLMEDAKAAATDIGQNLKESAAQSAQQVKDTGTEAVATVKDEGQSSVQTVKSDATP
jgi:gas vesicle protein